ncbi:stage 0 sporulation family protein [Chloroflexota bacterium]
MVKVAGVRFRKTGKVYYFDPADIELAVDDCVVVKTAHGIEIAMVAVAPQEIPDTGITEPLKPVLRKANEEDLARSQEFDVKEKEAFDECNQMITRLELSMKLLTAEYNMDGTHLTFNFSADGRVDFRRLVKELSDRFKVRVELRQVGPRDEAKIIGGLGRCGRSLCCSTFLSDFDPVSIRMAKDQDLPLDPMKISGICGRLMCCLSYENKYYCEVKAKMPKQNQMVKTPSGPGKVVGHNTLKNTISVMLESGAVVELEPDKLTLEEHNHQQKRS